MLLPGLELYANGSMEPKGTLRYRSTMLGIPEYMSSSGHSRAFVVIDVDITANSSDLLDCAFLGPCVDERSTIQPSNLKSPFHLEPLQKLGTPQRLDLVLQLSSRTPSAQRTEPQPCCAIGSRRDLTRVQPRVLEHQHGDRQHDTHGAARAHEEVTALYRIPAAAHEELLVVQGGHGLGVGPTTPPRRVWTTVRASHDHDDVLDSDHGPRLDREQEVVHLRDDGPPREYRRHVQHDPEHIHEAARVDGRLQVHVYTADGAAEQGHATLRQLPREQLASPRVHKPGRKQSRERLIGQLLLDELIPEAGGGC